MIAIVAVAFFCTTYFAMVLVFAIGVIRLQQKNDLTHETLPVSVVVAMRNEEQNINRLLQSIMQQDYPIDKFEVILVNDHSTDRTQALAEEWCNAYTNVFLANLPKDRYGKKEALSFGISQSKNDIIALTDADCLHPVHWLRSISSAYSTKNAALVIGNVEIAPANTLFEKMQALEYASLAASSLGACSCGIPFMASSANLSFSKSRIGFSSQMLKPSIVSGDDVFLLHSAKQMKGVKIGCLCGTSSAVSTRPVSTITAFFKQRARWASKATGYTDFTAISVGFVVLLYSLMLVGLGVFSFWDYKLLGLLLIAFLLKCLADMFLLYPFLKRQGNVSRLNVFLPLQLVYPIYISIAFAMAMLCPNSWKGR